MIDIHWIEREQVLLRWSFCGHWTAAEFYSALEQSLKRLRKVDEPITVILELETGIAPDNLLALASEGLSQLNDTVRQIIVVGHIPTWKSLHSILSYMMHDLRIPFQFVSTLEEAKQYCLQPSD